MCTRTANDRATSGCSLVEGDFRELDPSNSSVGVDCIDTKSGLRIPRESNREDSIHRMGRVVAED